MVKVNDIEFTGESYITTDESGVWIWEVKPEYKEIEGKAGWYLPEQYQGPGVSMLMNQVNGHVLPTLLNTIGKNFNDVLKVYDKPKIFKIVLEEVTYWKDDAEDTSKEMIDPIHKDCLQPFTEYISPARCQMMSSAVKLHNELLGIKNEN